MKEFHIVDSSGSMVDLDVNSMYSHMFGSGKFEENVQVDSFRAIKPRRCSTTNSWIWPGQTVYRITRTLSHDYARIHTSKTSYVSGPGLVLEKLKGL